MIGNDWRANNPELNTFLYEAAQWSDFAGSLVETVARRGRLSDRQQSAAEFMMAKVMARNTQKEVDVQNAPTVNLAGIRQLFDSATSNGLKRPKVRISGIAISLAPSHGKNPDALYIKKGGQYQGKITKENQMFLVSGHTEEVPGILEDLANKPMDALRVEGQKTGNCGLCGRELTKKDSIERGIGPICAQKYGIF